MTEGVINVYKEAGYTSHDVVAKLRGILGQRRIGHTGTLDPAATGVLPICLGRATKLSELLMDKTKEYEAVMLLGVTTDTQDMEGRVLSEKKKEASYVKKEEIEAALSFFRGRISQLPPMYSALKVGGKKLVDLARSGREVERKKREITIHSLEYVGGELPRVLLRVSCSKGTYIRTLCHDIGEALGVGAAMESLVRTRSGSFRIEEALTLDEIQRRRKEGSLSGFIKKVDAFFPSLPEKMLPSSLTKLAKNGNPLLLTSLKDVPPPADAHAAADALTAADTPDTTDVARGKSVGVVPDSGELHIPGRDCLRLYDDRGSFLGLYEYGKNRDFVKPYMLFFGESNDGMD